ncbi:hypothetical protein ACIBM1_09395 [Streptomyces sp. NPDC050481]
MNVRAAAQHVSVCFHSLRKIRCYEAGTTGEVGGGRLAAVH